MNLTLKIKEAEVKIDALHEIPSKNIQSFKYGCDISASRDVEEINTKIFQVKNMYPDLKCIQQCKEIQSIICSHTLVKTYMDECKTHIIIQANRAYEDFIQWVSAVDNHPLNDMVHEYLRSKQSCYKLQSRMKYLSSDLKRNKDSLWKSVKKEVTARGKCEDGYNVCVTHSYVIKQLDENNFNKLVKNLKEIEDTLSLDAFNSYLEELMNLRIEKFASNLLEDNADKLREGIDPTLQQEQYNSLKSGISVLFGCQRENTNDKVYIQTTRNWLQRMVSKLLQDGNFSEVTFLVNHIIRCPSGIDNWASQFIQLSFLNCDHQNVGSFVCSCCRNFFFLLFLILNPIPFRDFFLQKLKDRACVDSNFTVLDSDGEEEEFFEQVKTWSENDILSLLKQIPVRRLYNHLLLDDTKFEIIPFEEKMLKIFAFSTATTDILFEGMKQYNAENYPKLFQYLNHLIRHVLLYISNYWNQHEKSDVGNKISLQASYEKLFFHIVYQVYFNLKNWAILRTLPYEHISNKMLWNVLWIFFSNKLSEEEIFSEKDVETKIQEEDYICLFINKVEKTALENIFELFGFFEKMTISSRRDDDFVKFVLKCLFKVSFVNTTLRGSVLKEGCVIISSILQSYPELISIILQDIRDNDGSETYCLTLFKRTNLLKWTPQQCDLQILSTWLLSNSLCDAKNKLSRIILANLNWNFNKEGTLYLSHKLHRQIAVLVSDAYIKFNSTVNEWLVSKGIKQMLQFANFIGQDKDEEGFVHWAWNIMFSLKLHPLDTKNPPWISIYNGFCIDSDLYNADDDICSKLLSSENRHPSISYLIIAMTDIGLNMNKLLTTGLDCFSSLVESEQYMAAIKSLYYILPFFVKNSENLLDELRFIKALNDLITADTGIISNLASEPVIGTVLYNIAAMIKHQVYETSKSSIEYAVPIFNLWIKIFLKIIHHDKSSKIKLKYSAKQIHFLMDVLVKLSYIHSYTRDSVLDLLLSICKDSHSPIVALTFWKRIFSSSSGLYIVLNENIFPNYPFLAWYILMSELKQKNITELWSFIQIEMLTKSDSVFDCLKRTTTALNIDCPPVECLPIYRWAYQIITTPSSNPVLPLLWQQFFSYFFSTIQLPNAELSDSIGLSYFKSGPHATLLIKLKNHLNDDIKYCKDSLKLSDNFSSDSSSTSAKMKNESNFQLNVFKMLSAFHLWINNEFLHSSNLCLSALEPKYCPGRLGLILQGDQNPWYDLLPCTFIQDELDLKILPWHTQNIGAYTVKQSSTSMKESLQHQLSRHLENYEMAPLNLEYIPPIVTVQITDEVLLSTDSLMEFIHKEQSVVLEKAKYFAEQMKKIKQLNFNYINWIPQEYINEDYEVTQHKGCFKGHGENRCTGPACFKLKVQKYRKVSRISEKIDNNRAEIVILMDQLRNMSVKDLCYASVLIENAIKLLSQKMKAVKNGEANTYEEIGVLLFYRQINLIEKIISSVAEYLPSRLFFSSIIDVLGNEFIHNNENEMQNLANTILNHPEAGSLAMHHFNPNTSSLEYFQPVYETLSKAVGKYSPSILLALFSKIDFTEWLRNNNPDYEYRIKIFSGVSTALLSCGFIPSPEVYPVFEILKKHFNIILSYRFPEHFSETIAFLIKGINSKSLCIDIFYDAFSCFGCPLFNDKSTIEEIEAGLNKFLENQQLPANQQMLVSSSQLNHNQIKCATNTLHVHFMEQRKCFQLYKKHALLIKPIGIMLAVISDSLVMLEKDVLQKGIKINLSNVWENFQAPFSPWLHPLDDGKSISFPWSEDEFNLASFMFQVYIICLKHFHQVQLSNESEDNVLSCVLNHYMQVYVYPGYRHFSFSIYHNEMLNLPWHEFSPSPSEINKLCNVMQSKLEESKQFLSKICVKIKWFDVLKQISTKQNPKYVGDLLSTTAKLLITSELNCSQSDKKISANIFKELDDLSWHYLSIEMLNELLDLYFSNFKNIDSVQELPTNCDRHTLKFLKLLCCMVPNENTGDYSNSKRITFLQKYISKYASATFNESPKIKSELLKTFLPSLFSEVDNIICNAVAPDCQVPYAIPLVKEMLLFFNYYSDHKDGSIVLKSVIEWFKQNTKSPLLLPCINVISNVKCTMCMVSLVECCISVRFSTEILDSNMSNTVWQLISSCFQMPSSFKDEFINKCVEENAFLTLYSYVICVTPKCSLNDQKKKLLQQEVQWIGETKLKADAEAKFLLIWDKILELSIALALEGEFQIVKQELVLFSWYLSALAEDRTNSGILATFGFGQSSSLSVNFRFLCRVIAAFVLYQIPDTGVIHLEQLSPKQISPSVTATKSLDNLKGLLKKKPYAALYSQIDYAVQCIVDAKYNLSESRKFLKYFAILFYSKESYLSALDL